MAQQVRIQTRTTRLQHVSLEEEDLDVPMWHRRTAHMVRLLKRHLTELGEAERPLRLIDLGCGVMAAEGLLVSHGLEQIEYIPSDRLPRDHRTLVIDLDGPGLEERLPAVDVAFLGEVLEHLDDPGRLLRALGARARFLLFSYCPVREGKKGKRGATGESGARGQDEASRRGWKNHMTVDEVRALAESLVEHGGRVVVDASFERTSPQPVCTFFVQIGEGRAR